MPAIKWREYLKGEYIIKNENQRAKMDYDIRVRAKQMMEDLLLIAQKSNTRQRTQIFKIPPNERREKLVIPLIKALHDNSMFITPESKEFDDLVKLMQDLERTKTEYDIVKLFDTEHPDNKIYRQHKRQQVNQKLEERGEVIFKRVRYLQKKTRVKKTADAKKGSFTPRLR